MQSQLRFIPRFLSRVFVNWFKAGGTLSLSLRTLFFLWISTCLGHLTNRVRSLFGGNAPPIPNCLGLFSNKGLTTFSFKIKTPKWQYHNQTQTLSKKALRASAKVSTDFFFAAATGAFPPRLGACRLGINIYVKYYLVSHERWNNQKWLWIASKKEGESCCSPLEQLLDFRSYCSFAPSIMNEQTLKECYNYIANLLDTCKAMSFKHGANCFSTLLEKKKIIFYVFSSNDIYQRI